MNNSTGKTRFICRVVRFQTALSGHGPKTTGHTANCPECQAYFQASEAIVTGLRRTAAQETQRPSDDLTARIALAARQSAPRPARSRRPLANLSLLVGATAAVAMAFFVVRGNLPTQSNTPKNAAQSEISPSDMAGLVSNVDQLRIRFLNSVEPAATKLAAGNPLTQELNSVQADARSALGFLALNFLPSDSARSIGASTDSTRS